MASTQLEDHPAAGIFPMLDAESFEHLKSDIQKHGQRDMVVLLDGQIIDGRNRYRACIELGIEPDVCELEECDDPVAYVLSTNLHRRQLLTSQKAMCAAKVACLAKGEAGNSRSQNLGTYTAEQAAELFSVSTGTIEFARRVLREGCTELITLCEQGESVATACKFIAACKSKKDQSGIAKQGWKAIADRAKQGKPVDSSTTVVQPPTQPPSPKTEPATTYTCENCGEHEKDDDGDCAKCREPAVVTDSPSPPNPTTKKPDTNDIGKLIFDLDTWLEDRLKGQKPHVAVAVADHLTEVVVPRLLKSK